MSPIECIFKKYLGKKLFVASASDNNESDQRVDSNESAISIPYGPARQPWSDIPLPPGAFVTAPGLDPNAKYETVPPKEVVSNTFPRIKYSDFQVPPTGLSVDERRVALDSFKLFIETQHENFAGFQGNQDESYQGKFSYLLDMHANNIGDPFSSGRYTLNSKFCERAVLDWFAALWNIDWPHDPSNPNSYWGYVLTMGFTEGNIYSMYNSRDYLKGRILLDDKESEHSIDDRLSRGKDAPERKLSCVEPVFDDDVEPANYYTPVLFYSEDVHYSVTKAGRIVSVETFTEIGRREYPGQCPINGGKWPDAVPSQNYDKNNPNSGSVIVSDLEALVEFYLKKNHPIIVVANIGTTWKGAYDDVPAINAMLQRLGKRYSWLWDRPVRYQRQDGSIGIDKRRGFWLAVDGALGGPFLPFIEMAHSQGLVETKGPIFDFRNDAVMSVGCSMHKWIGGPWPGGVFLTRTRYQLQPPDEAQAFLGTPDTTLGGSRSAFSPMILWDYISRMSYDNNIHKAVHTLKMAEALEDKLRELEARLQDDFGTPEDPVDLWIARSQLSLTVRFRLVNENLNYKYSLDTDRYWVPFDVEQEQKQQRSYSHIFAMDSLTPDLIDRFISDLADSVYNATEPNWHNTFPRIDINAGLPNPGPPEPVFRDGGEEKRLLLPCKRRWAKSNSI